MHTRFRLSVSVFAVVAATAPVLVPGESAHAACEFNGGGASVGVTCTDDYNATLAVTAQTVTLTPPFTSVVSDLSGNNVIDLQNSPGSNIFSVGTIAGESTAPFVDLNAGDDTYRLDISNNVNLDEHFGYIRGGPGNDRFEYLSGITFLPTGLPVDEEGFIFFGDGGNDTYIDGVGVEGKRVDGGAGDDTFIINGAVGFPFSSGFRLDNPNAIVGGSGNDTFTINETGEVRGILNGGDGNDIFNFAGTSIWLSDPNNNTFSTDGDAIRAGAGDDIVNVLETGSTFAIRLEDGNDTLVSRGTISAEFTSDGVAADGGDGNDTLEIRGGAINDALTGFETVTIFRSDDTPFSGDFDVVGVAEGTTDFTITGQGNNDGFEFDVFNVRTFTIDNSDINIGINDFAGDYEAGQLNVLNGSLVRFVNPITLRAPDGGLGSATVDGARVSFVDGFTNGNLTVNNLTLNDAFIAIDVDPNDGTADQILVNGVLSRSGQNTVEVNFTDTIIADGITTVPFISVLSEEGGDTAIVPSDEFLATAISPSASAILSVTETPDGSLFLNYTGDNIVITNPSAPLTAEAANQNRLAVDDTTTDFLDRAIGFSDGQAAGVQITPTFGVFANGTAGRTFHNGYSVTSPTTTGDTPEFDATSFSIIGSAELDASAEFGIEDIGLRFGAFAGYANTDLELARTLPNGGATAFRGSGVNDSFVGGGSVLVSKIQGLGNLNYGMLAAAGFVGSSDVTLANTGTTGDYNTNGVIISAKAGRNIAIEDRLRLDVRFGAAYVDFHGDSYTDSAGNRFGATNTSYGLISFEPGLSTAMRVGDAVVSPFARAMIQHRIGYENTAKFGGETFDFDDADFSVGGQLGANVRVNDRVSAGANLEGRASSDQQSLLAKLSVKVTLRSTQ